MIINRSIWGQECVVISTDFLSMRITFLFFIGLGGIFPYNIGSGSIFYHQLFGLYRQLFEYISQLFEYIVNFKILISHFSKIVNKFHVIASISFLIKTKSLLRRVRVLFTTGFQLNLVFFLLFYQYYQASHRFRWLHNPLDFQQLKSVLSILQQAAYRFREARHRRLLKSHHGQ